MATAVLSHTGTITGEWDSTPPTAEADHHTLINGALPPGDDTSFLEVFGHVAGKIEEQTFTAGAGNIQRVTNVHWEALVEGTVVTNAPALRLEILLDGTVIGFKEFSLITTWGIVSMNIPVDVLGIAWNAGERSRRLTPLNGDSGYPGNPHDVDPG